MRPTLRSLAEAALRMPMEADMEELIGAARHERIGERLSGRSGFRAPALETRLGLPERRIPKLRQGSHSRSSPSLGKSPGSSWSPSSRVGRT